MLFTEFYNYSVLNRIRDIGLTLISLNRTELKTGE
jgi:hypothetical protein